MTTKKINLDTAGIVFLINSETGSFVANLPNEGFLRIPAAGEYICYLDKSYIVKSVVHSFQSIALIVKEEDVEYVHFSEKEDHVEISLKQKK